MRTTSISHHRPRRATGEELGRLWSTYRRTGDRQHRDELVFLLTPLVRHIVGRKARQIPSYCELDDLAAAGFEALLVSIERFDPSKGATLDQFAWTRIHGAVLDELRRRDWAPRSLRRWERDVERTTRELRVEGEREPTDAELAERLEVSVEELRQRRDQLAMVEVESLSTPVTGSDGTIRERSDVVVSDDEATQPEQATLVREAHERLMEAVSGLPARERSVALLLYFEGLRLREIGELLGVSESRVCQINGSIRRRLRAVLGEHMDLLVAAVR